LPGLPDADAEQQGSRSYVSSDSRNDQALHVALDLLRGTKLGLYPTSHHRSSIGTRSRHARDVCANAQPEITTGIINPAD
jgi:hypothetical protein